ncbi:MAG: NAD-dependent protein deacylase [Firmicutes bacterium]|nr:NAD-dependent protein deacylase [Bacillota bacterium]MBO2521466.1 NAD-dependent protein deacylase [Bacillota bacterium]
MNRGTHSNGDFEYRDGRRAEERLLEELSRVQRLVVLTGAGMSTESGLPDFRSPDGLWRKYRPEELATVEALFERPLLFYAFYRSRLELLDRAAPNAGHRALAQLEKEGRLRCIVTQNVDGLHTAAGSRRVLEIHGSLRKAHCHTCGRPHSPELLKRPVTSLSGIPRCPCGGPVRPGIVLFGELLPQEALAAAVEAVQECDALLVVGTSLAVYPAASLPQLARDRGARLWILNLEPTPYDAVADLVVRGKAAEVLGKLARERDSFF